jgi:hypothetical protein
MDETDEKFDETGARLAGIKAPPPARSRAKELDLIRLLLARIKDFKKQYLEIKKTPWVI